MIHLRLDISLPLHVAAHLQLYGDAQGIRRDHCQPHAAVAAAATDVTERTALRANRFEKIGVCIL